MRLQPLGIPPRSCVTAVSMRQAHRAAPVQPQHFQRLGEIIALRMPHHKPTFFFFFFLSYDSYLAALHGRRHPTARGDGRQAPLRCTAPPHPIGRHSSRPIGPSGYLRGDISGRCGAGVACCGCGCGCGVLRGRRCVPACVPGSPAARPTVGQKPVKAAKLWACFDLQ